MNRRYLRAPALLGAQTTTARGLEASSRRGGYREHFTRQRSACRNPPNVQLETCEKHTSSLLDGGRRGQVAEAIHPPLESRGFLALLGNPSCLHHQESGEARGRLRSHFVRSCCLWLRAKMWYDKGVM